jgi:arsenate reductase
MLFICYPRCLTCRKAKVWLDGRGASYETRDIVKERPSAGDLRFWQELSGLPLSRFFNTSGLLYKKLALKDKLPLLNEEEKLSLLASDGLLVKRPLLIGEDFTLVGFKETEWEARLGGVQKKSKR